MQQDPLPSEILTGLNPSQSQAVLHGTGPLLIVAGAGTGKTTVLTKRIAHLIISKQALPKEILALTFTDKAANEMEERVDRLVPYGFNDVWVSTFHSFGDKILREHSFEIGLSPDLKVMTLPEAVVFVRQHLFEFKLEHYRPLTDPTRFVEALLTTFSRAKDEDITSEMFLQSAEKQLKDAQNKEEKDQAEKNLEAAKAFGTYEALKTKYGFIDFGDQVILALKIFREHPAILKKYQERFKYVLVDEFQDTNYAQFELLKLLTASHHNITVVGDDDQSIYKFRGACLSNILGFRKSYPEAKEIVLQENYRSTQAILDSAYKLIQHNNPDRLEYRDKISKFLRSQKKEDVSVQHVPFDSIFSESDYVSSEIKKQIGSGTRDPKDFAILVRTNAGAEPFIKSLNLLGMPWRFSGNAGLYEQEEIRLALSFLRVLDQPSDSASLYYLAVSDIYKLDSEICAQLTEQAMKTNQSLWEVLQDRPTVQPSDCPTVRLSDRQTVGRLVSDVKKYRKLSMKMSTGHLLYQFFEESGQLKRLAESNDFRSVQQAQNLHRFFEIIKKFGQVAQYDRVHYFVEYVESLRLAGEDPASAEASLDDNAINILTVHAAKGLEFPVVFLVGLEQGHFPVRDRGDPIELPENLIKDILPSGNTHVQEERRLFYVGMTRAKEELILCSARDHGKKKLWKKSQFVLECMDKPEVEETVQKQHPLESLKIFSSKNSPMEKPVSSSTPDPAPVTLSPTSMENYLICPLKYKFSHILRIPVPMHHTAVFGMAVHEALKGYHLARKENKPMTQDQFIELFKNAWRNEGFISREHEEKRFQEGIKLLKAYYKKEEASETLPGLVEESFKMLLADAKMRGRWDRVDVTDSESVIIDYKTKDVKDQKEADQKARESVQLVIYAIAFQNRFGKLPDRTILHFIKNDLIGTWIPNPEKIEKIVEAAGKAAKGIQNKEFNPTPGHHCRWCAYEKICPAVEKG